MPDVQEILESVASALGELRASLPLRRLLHVVRFAGNRLNLQGSLDCSATHAPATIAAVRSRAAVALKLNGKLLQVCSPPVLEPAVWCVLCISVHGCVGAQFGRCAALGSALSPARCSRAPLVNCLPCPSQHGAVCAVSHLASQR